MGIFDSIKLAIFGEAKAETVATPGAAPVPGGLVPPSTTSTSTASTGSPTGPAMASVDGTPILDKAVAYSFQQLNWKTSIVDLLKARKMDSSLTARKELAHEFGNTGSMDEQRHDEHLAP